MVIHTGPKSGGKKVTLFGSDCYDGVSAGKGVIHTSLKSGGEKVTLFGSDCDGGVSAGLGSYIQLPNLGAKKSHFLAVIALLV